MNIKPENNIAIITVSYRPISDTLLMWVKPTYFGETHEDNVSRHQLADDLSVEVVNVQGQEIFSGLSVIQMGNVQGWQALASAYLHQEVISAAENFIATCKTFSIPEDSEMIIPFLCAMKLELFVDADKLVKQLV